MLTKEGIKKELSNYFRGKEVAVSQGEQPWLFTAAVADMIYCERKDFEGWVQIMAKVDINLNERSRLSWYKMQLDVDLNENKGEKLGISEETSNG